MSVMLREEGSTHMCGKREVEEVIARSRMEGVSDLTNVGSSGQWRVLRMVASLSSHHSTKTVPVIFGVDDGRENKG